mmetsp:Transcript_87440/g.187564  ORF Transcript_87440/g.187564 Transcript_87440/m.187564 type:complete len:386 (-) Transcript_87440:53-1210(-)|eukprot:CAMPEP_0180434834 /NCGR_PEP_ID=MMETSP1036_2-20121128/10161_1 /TAXON_ID=632150 /ORGANISM="Azadinium spinosum, Strain 3D9" /LENGTH=385 /DNA_ID=CAMNT_0022440723 /DNA_START=67 /DNA_END=1224 /DNA_ORIENTATION=+
MESAALKGAPGEASIEEYDDIDLETELFLMEVRSYVCSMLIPIMIFLLIAIQPFSSKLGHLRAISVCIVLLEVFGCAVARFAANWAGSLPIQRIANIRDRASLCVRTLVHIMIAYSANHSTFLRVVSLLMMPLCSVRQSNSLSDFKVYLLGHSMLTLLRFRDDFEDGLPWIGGVMFANCILLDIARQMDARKSTCLICDQSMRILQCGTEATITKLMTGCCSAVVSLRSDLQIASLSSSFAALLSCDEEILMGRPFPDIVDIRDRDAFFEMIQVLPDADGQDCSVNAHRVQLRLGGIVTKHVRVSISHAWIKTKDNTVMHILGVHTKKQRQGHSMQFGTPPVLGRECLDSFIGKPRHFFGAPDQESDLRQEMPIAPQTVSQSMEP